MKDAAAVMREDDKEEEDAEGGGVDGEEVDGADGFEVVLEKGLPGLTGRAAFRGRGHVFGHGGLTDLNTEFEELAVDARGSPGGIGQRYVFDEGDDFGVDCRAALGVAHGEATPVAAKKPAMPGDDRIGLEEEEGRAPFSPVIVEENPEFPVRIRELWAFVASFHRSMSNDELVA